MGKPSFHFYLAAMLACTGVVVSGALTAAEAQRQQPNLKRLLLLPPVPENREQDSLFSIAFVEEARDRLAGRVRRSMRVVETEQYCEALEASGFACGALLDQTSSEQLARFLQSDAYVVGWMGRSGDVPVVRMRLIDLRRSGMGGWVVAEGAAGQMAEDLARTAVDSLREQVRAAGHVQECARRRDRSDYDGAKNRAQRAFEMYPNHPAAALCVARVAEAAQEPEDSIIAAYERAVLGDSLFTTGWERLGRLYLAAGDTTRAVDAFVGQLRSDPGNIELRQGVVAQKILLEDFEGALELVEEGIALYPASMSLLQLKARTCRDGERWACALDAFNQQYELDPIVAEAEAFIQQAIGAADFAEDTTEYIRWTGIAVNQDSQNVPYLSAHAAALRDGGQVDSAMAVYRVIGEIDPENTTAPLAMVQVMLDGLEIDSTVPLDTMTMQTADSIMEGIAERSAGETAVLQNIAALYFSKGAQLAQVQGFHPGVAMDWLANSLELPLSDRFQPQANFFLGFATLFHLQPFFELVRDSESCDLVAEYEMIVTRGQSAIMAGQSVSAQAAMNIRSTLDQFAGLIPNFKEAFQCQ